MPHAVFESGLQAASADLAARQLIPGIEPGGTRAGGALKPALLINDAYLELMAYEGQTDTPAVASIYLKLSHEESLDPGLLLLVGQVAYLDDSTSGRGGPAIVQLGDKLSGRIFAPKYVGIRILNTNFTTNGIDVDVHLDYEMISVPWQDWFIMWDFLDNVVNNERQF